MEPILKNGKGELIVNTENMVYVCIALAKTKKQRDDLLEVCKSLENDTGTIPKTIWDMRNKAIAAAEEGK